jgi:hypothetical protein
LALQIDENNIDALQAMGNLRLIRGREKEASQFLLAVVKRISEI